MRLANLELNGVSVSENVSATNYKKYAYFKVNYCKTVVSLTTAYVSVIFKMFATI